MAKKLEIQGIMAFDFTVDGTPRWKQWKTAIYKG
jgi:hypothetical protein